MNILITGGAGYLGSVLIPKLLIRGHKLRVLDLGYFGVGHLRFMRQPIEVIREDIRAIISDKQFCESLLSGVDCIIHLAAISNDPSAELYPELTTEVNVEATKVLAEKAREKGIRFIFSSSCSVYGEHEGDADEDSGLQPLTVYAVSKLESEKLLESLKTKSWSPVILRNGTLFGYSPRMRFDLVLNIFSLYSSLYNEIKIFGEGYEWRPFLHVADCAQAMVFFAEKKQVQFSCYNVSHQNLRVIDLADIFKKVRPDLDVQHIKMANQDLRNYRVSTERIESEGFKTRISLDLGVEDMMESIENGVIQDPEAIYYRNVKWLKELTQIGGKTHKDMMAFIESMATMNMRNRQAF